MLIVSGYSVKNYLSFSVCISSFCAVLFLLPRRYGPQTPFVCTRWRTKLYISFICLDNYILSRILKGKAVVLRIRIRIRRIQMFLGLLDYGSIGQKNLDSTVLWLLFLHFIVEKWYKCPFKEVSWKTYLKKYGFLLASWRSMTKIAGSGLNRICRSGSRSTPKCHGSATLESRMENKFRNSYVNFSQL